MFVFLVEGDRYRVVIDPCVRGGFVVGKRNSAVGDKRNVGREWARRVDKGCLHFDRRFVDLRDKCSYKYIAVSERCRPTSGGQGDIILPAL